MRELAQLIGLTGIVLTCCTALLHILFAMGIYRIASRRAEFHQEGCYCVTPLVWSAATLLGGVFVAAVYWLIHDSGLSRAPLVSDQPASESRDFH